VGSNKYCATADLAKLENFERKSLSAVMLGGNGFLVPPERSNIVLSCLADPSDLSGLVDRVQISDGNFPNRPSYSPPSSAARSGQMRCGAPRACGFTPATAMISPLDSRLLWRR